MIVIPFFQTLGFIFSPIASFVSIVVSLIALAKVIMNLSVQSDSFYVKIDLKKQILFFYNKGKYRICIKNIQLGIITDVIEPISDNMLRKELRITGQDKIKKDVSCLWLNSLRKQAGKNIYILFDVESESGLFYDQLVYLLKDSKNKFYYSKRKLKQEAYQICW
ncbi:MAG: hypothetical protein KBT11_10595 [Treponema sp.]|nr:hypothetical protein [Candidatus Treponema equifaecale]